MNEMKKQPFVFLAIPTETPHQPITTCTVPSNIRRLQSTIPMASLAGKRKRGADEEAAAGGSGPSQRSGNMHVPNPEDIDLTCPISLELFENPVVASDGNTYSRAGIEEWFRNGHHNSPLTQERLELTLYPNRAVAKNVQKYKTTLGLKLIELIERCPDEPTCEGRAIDMLEEGKADLNARREIDRRTPLLVAAEQGLRGLVDIIVEKGADYKATDSDGKGVEDFLSTMKPLFEVTVQVAGAGRIATLQVRPNDTVDSLKNKILHSQGYISRYGAFKQMEVGVQRSEVWKVTPTRKRTSQGWELIPENERTEGTFMGDEEIRHLL